MRLNIDCLNAGLVRVFSLLMPVGPSLGLGWRDEWAWSQLVEELD